MTGAPTALVAEDEEPQRRELCVALNELWPQLQIVAECADGLSALEALTVHSPRLALLDIRMPGVSGLEVARAAGPDVHVIFTTAYEEYAINAFERGAIDYLLKPVKRERLKLALERVRERLAQGRQPDIQALLSSLQAQLAASTRHTGIQWITASAGNTTKMFPIADVLFFQAQEKYTRVATQRDEAYIRTSLKELAEALNSEEFWQIHRSAIVRASAIHAVHREDDGKLTLEVRGRRDRLPVSSAFHYRFKGM